jgi:hypothetical protein
MLQHINVDVQCSWSEDSPIYRLYVDEDMITERTFAWPGYKVYIKENLICDLDKGRHELRIENCSPKGSFNLENVFVENNLLDKQYRINTQTWCFYV